MLVQPQDLATELYQEIIDEITRSDPNEVILQLKSAEDLVKSYLFKYNLKALFGTDTVAPTHPDENLKKIIKIIAAYWLVRKANPNASLTLFREDMEMMIGTRNNPGWLTDIKEGKTNPDWPYKIDDPDTLEGDESIAQQDVHWSSNTKRNNSFD